MSEVHSAARRRQLAVVGATTDGGTGQFVAGRLLSSYPELFAQFDFERNPGVDPAIVAAGSGKRYWWKCARGEDHTWQQTPHKRTAGSGCPYCAGKRLSKDNSLAARFPEVAADFDSEKNGIEPAMVLGGSEARVWWKCAKGDDHSWDAPISKRTRGRQGCPFCSGHRVSKENNLLALFPDIARQFDTVKNGIDPSLVNAGSNSKYWWKCDQGDDHSWPTTVSSRTRIRTGCPSCAGKKVSSTNSLAARYPSLAREFSAEKNGVDASKVLAGGYSKTYWWTCAAQGHSWKATIYSRTGAGRGCPRCNSGWTRAAVRGFVEELLPYIDSLTQAELHAVCERAGISDSTAREFAYQLSAGTVSLDELRRIVEDDSSGPVGELTAALSSKQRDDADRHAPRITPDASAASGRVALPALSVDAILAPSAFLLASDDTERVEYLLAARVAVLWAAAYADEHLVDAESFERKRDAHQELVRSSFRTEFDAARALPTPARWAFRPNGADRVVEPNLMQRHVAVQVRDRRRVGNWSAAGAGKTVSAVLASRAINADLTVVVCPNSTIEGWVRTIRSCDPAARIATRGLEPVWPAGEGPRWLVVNYERLQQPTASAQLAALVEQESIDFLVVDEVHFAKARTKAESIRRGNLRGLAARATDKTPGLAVLGMSATPVVNELFEARSLLELVEGVDLSDVQIEPTIDNAMKIHQRLVRTGARWKPTYSVSLESEDFVTVDCTDLLDDVRTLGRHPHPALVEQVLIEAKLPVIVEACLRGGKTLVYTEFLEGVLDKVVPALRAAGLRVGVFTGRESATRKAAVFEAFLGECPPDAGLDVLIGSSTIGTGVDGLQRACSRVVFATLPWTHAAYEQIIGRVYRQGSTSAKVEVVVPITYASPTGSATPWSWCGMRWERIDTKRTLADAAVDGVFPSDSTQITPAQATREAIAWLARLDEGNVITVERAPLTGHLDATPLAQARRRRQFGDFSLMNQRWNATRSARTHARLQENPQEWWHYHDLYRQARESWTCVPAERLARWALDRGTGLTIADLGCGEMLLADIVGDRHTVLGFDHVAFDVRVTVADISAVPLPDASVDVAVLSLALMGSNYDQYLDEARRILPIDKQLWLVETVRHVGSDKGLIERALGERGFDVAFAQFDDQFVLIRAIRSEREVASAVWTPLFLGSEASTVAAA